MIKLLNHEHFIREVSTCAVVVNRVGTIALTIICIIYEWLEGKGHTSCGHVKMALYCHSNTGELFKIEVKISQLPSLNGDCVRLKEATTAQ